MHLINMSATGALLRLREPSARGTRIATDLGAGFAEARTIWTNGARFGVASDRQIDNRRMIDRLVRR